MPLTPFHWSIVLFGLLFLSHFYIPALAISSVIMDFEPFYYIFISPNPEGTLHGFFHTYLGATIIAVLVGFILVKTRKHIDNIMEMLKTGQKNIPDKLIYFSSLFAAWSHIFLDSLMHTDMRPFWPIATNPLLGLIEPEKIYLITGLGFILAGLLYFRYFATSLSARQ